MITGIGTEQCCETTARLAADLGYQVTFVTDATATHPIPHPAAPAGQTVDELMADPRTLPADAVIERTEYALAGRFAIIRTVAELTSGVLQADRTAADRPRSTPPASPSATGLSAARK